ncbi:MAG: hypothetical protein AAB389_01980 [Patescibacteria group bacterium]
MTKILLISGLIVYALAVTGFLILSPYSKKTDQIVSEPTDNTTTCSLHIKKYAGTMDDWEIEWVEAEFSEGGPAFNPSYEVKLKNKDYTIWGVDEAGDGHFSKIVIMKHNEYSHQLSWPDPKKTPTVNDSGSGVYGGPMPSPDDMMMAQKNLHDVRYSTRHYSYKLVFSDTFAMVLPPEHKRIYYPSLWK